MYKLSQTSPAPESDPEEQQQHKKNDNNNMGGEIDTSDNKKSGVVCATNHKNPYGLSVRPKVETSFTSKLVSSSAPSSANSNGGGGVVSGAGSNNNNKMTTKKTSSLHKSLPPLFLYMETGDFRRAAERAKNHPREVKTWASIKLKSSSSSGGGGGGGQQGAKRLALHQACFKLRAASSCLGNDSAEEDAFIDVCRFILLLVRMYPDAAGMRESRHGCLPLHLAAFASCIRQTNNTHSAAPAAKNDDNPTPTAAAAAALSPMSTFSTSSLSSALPSPAASTPGSNARSALLRPATISHRSASESTTDTMQTTMTAAMAQEDIGGGMQTNAVLSETRQRSHLSASTAASGSTLLVSTAHQTQSVSVGSNIFVSEKREEWAVKVLNALLDAYPRAIRMDSEGGRLPLHTAAAGRSTPRVVTTLVTANPAAARHRNKDGYLPLHLVAHWGQSDPRVAVTLLRAYPDATFGRNRWERTPLEEALCMAGENGRPHQAALVRALRKHPSYWTKPDGMLFQASSAREGGHHIVDIDASLPSMDDSTIDDDELFFDIKKSPKDKNSDAEVPSAKMNDLPTLIRGQHWNGVLERLDLNPSEAKMPLRVPTRGGFSSTTDFFPLHYACERRPPAEVVKRLLQMYPEAASKRAMPGGALPIHIAATWYSHDDSIMALLQVDRSSCKTTDELGNLPLHSACFSGTSTVVLEHLLRAYPKAVLARNNQGSLPEEITKRLKHDNRVSSLALLNLCRDEVIAKRQQKHRRNRSDGYMPSAKEAMVLNERDSHVNPGKYEIENCGPGDAGVEITYSGGNSTNEDDLMWV